ncbi:MAG: hypothetical protein M1378_12950 [Bacteroidetes bacterium]|nr:hypothetical protein [Bacteroidota bacterium]
MAAEVDCENLVVRSESCEEIVAAYKTLDERIKEVELEGLGEDLHSLSALPLGLPVRIKLHPEDAPNLYTNTWLSDRFSLEALMDVDKGILQGVKIATSAMVPVTVNLEELNDAGELMSVLNYYLHDTHLQVPVDFFHSMISAYLQGTTLALPDLYTESPAHFLYVDELGKVSASARLARAGRFLGTFSDSLQIDEESQLYKDLLDRKKNLVLSGSKCVSCERFDLCEGYLRFVDANFDCGPFLEVFNEIKAKVKEIADDLAGAEKLKE